MKLNNYTVNFVGDRVVKVIYDPLIMSSKPILIREFIYGLNKSVICYLANATGFFALWHRFINPSFRLVYFDQKSNELYLRISGIYNIDKNLDDRGREIIVNSILLYIRMHYTTEDN